jgi:hypothetical protein
VDFNLLFTNVEPIEYAIAKVFRPFGASRGGVHLAGESPVRLIFCSTGSEQDGYYQ